LVHSWSRYSDICHCVAAEIQSLLYCGHMNS